MNNISSEYFRLKSKSLNEIHSKYKQRSSTKNMLFNHALQKISALECAFSIHDRSIYFNSHNSFGNTTSDLNKLREWILNFSDSFLISDRMDLPDDVLAEEFWNELRKYLTLS